MLTACKMSSVTAWLLINTLSLSRSLSVSLLTATVSAGVMSCRCRNSTCRASCCLSRSRTLSFANRSNFYTHTHTQLSHKLLHRCHTAVTKLYDILCDSCVTVAWQPVWHLCDSLWQLCDCCVTAVWQLVWQLCDSYQTTVTFNNIQFEHRIQRPSATSWTERRCEPVVRIAVPGCLTVSVDVSSSPAVDSVVLVCYSVLDSDDSSTQPCSLAPRSVSVADHSLPYTHSTQYTVHTQ